MKTNIIRFLAAAAALAVSTPVFAAGNLTGSYLLTITNARPAHFDGTQLCATLNEDGSTLGFPNSGTVTINGSTGSFFTKNHSFTAEVPNGESGFVVFSGELGHPQIQGTSFLGVSQGKIFIAGLFTAVRSTCGQAD